MNNRLTTEEILGLTTTNISQNETNSGASNLHFTESTSNFNSLVGPQSFIPREFQQSLSSRLG
jgi:hypothetical protein